MQNLQEKQVQIKPEHLAEYQNLESKMLKRTKQFVSYAIPAIKDLSDAILTLLHDNIEDSLENNAEKAASIAYVINFICEQQIDLNNIEFFEKESEKD